MPKAKKKPLKKMTKEESCCDHLLTAAMLIVLLLVSIGSYIYYKYDNIRGPKYSVGDCLINRGYALVKVESVSGIAYELKHQSTVSNLDQKGFYLQDADEYEYKSSDHYFQESRLVDLNYTQIPCKSKELK